MLTKRCRLPCSSRSCARKPGYSWSRLLSSSFTVVPLPWSVRFPPVTPWTSGGTRTSTGIDSAGDGDFDWRFDGGLEVRHAAELLVIDELLDGRVVAAHLAL